MAQLSEAEVAGDPAVVRRLLARLNSRSAYPAKVFIFAEDLRPGYFGTHTKTSSVITPRNPFRRDAVALDYTCDSGAEWEGEEEGAGDDVAGGSDDEEGGEDEDDSDADSWLVDDDGEVEDVGEPPRLSPFSDISLGPMSIDPLPTPLSPKRRKVPKPEEERKAKKRKVVVPLVAFTKGPCWESEIGRCNYEPFNAYRIQLFNG
jgi:chromatin assembly factor 1 subunit A